MYSIVTTAIVYGLEGRCIRVEADVSNGLPVFEMVGFLSSEVKEAKERVRTALHNCGYTLPAKRITINLFPANVKKSGTGCTANRGNGKRAGDQAVYPAICEPDRSQADRRRYNLGREGSFGTDSVFKGKNIYRKRAYLYRRNRTE